jgi:hypothetical protein
MMSPLFKKLRFFYGFSMVSSRAYSLFINAALVFAVSACASAAPSPSCPPPISGDLVYVVEEGWHVEIGLPVEELGENLAFYQDIFDGARIIMFGYGKQTFITAPPETISEYFLGPFPGPAVIQTVGLRITPPEAYLSGKTVTLALPPGGAQALAAYIWNDLAKDEAGRPRIVAHSHNPEGLFYAAQSGYNLLHTCNTWAADALAAAGLPISGDNVTFAHQVMLRVDKAAEAQCPTLVR